MKLPLPSRRAAPWLIAALAVPWLIVAKLVVPAMIRQAYAGESIGVLNRLISGQERNSVDVYLNLWNQGTWPVVGLLLTGAVGVWALNRFDVREPWNRYWFRPAPVFDLAVVRIAVIGFELVYIYLSVSNGYVREALAYPEFKYVPLPILRVLWPGSWLGVQPPAGFVEILGWVTIVFGALALVGLRTRLSLSVFAYGAIFLHAFVYSFGDYHHPEAILMLALVMLPFAPSGEALSLDAWIRRRKESGSAETVGTTEKMRPDAGWPLRLIQWLFVLAYLSAAVIKLTEQGFDWMNGYTLQYYLVRDATRWGSDLGVALSQFYVVAILLSWVTIIFEATFVVPVLVPRLRWVYIPVGILLHIGIYVTMRAPFFQYLPLYAVFVPWAAIVRRGSRAGRLPAEESRVPA